MIPAQGAGVKERPKKDHREGHGEHEARRREMKPANAFFVHFVFFVVRNYLCSSQSLDTRRGCR